ncbi:MAG: tetratricopeptide repeat protein [Mesorhizobium sp.]
MVVMIDSADQNLILQMYQEALGAFGAGEYVRAQGLLRRVVEFAPSLPEGHHALGVCYYCQLMMEEAERSIRTALSLKEDADFYLNLALVLQNSNNLHGAVDAYRASLQLKPDSPKAYNNLANILGRLRQNDEAIRLYQKAILCDPNYMLSYTNLAFALGEMGRPAEAIAIYKSIGAWGDAQALMRYNLLWEDLAETTKKHLAALAAGSVPPAAPWNTLLVEDVTPDMERRAAHDSTRAGLPELSAAPLCVSRSVLNAGRRLRVGYLSSEFFNHATMHLLAGVLESHNQNQIDFRIFSYSQPRDDLFTERLRAADIPATNLVGLSDIRAAREIARQEIDILVDLKGHTKSVRLGITALRPVPIIVNWLGYPGTLGHPRLADYIIGDPVVTPVEDASFYSERLALMPHCYQPNDNKRPLPYEMTRSEVGLPEQAIVFCNFNNAVKFNPRMMDLWCRILKAVPNSVFWLLDQDPAIKRVNLDREFRTRGIPPERIFYSPFAQQAEHASRLQLADLALDTFPYTSHTTASDTVWSGVPLITLKGKTFASRVAASLLATHGFSELIVTDDEAYFQLAVELANNLERRMNLKAAFARA